MSGYTRARTLALGFVAISLGACSPTIKDAVYNEPIASSVKDEFPGTAADAKIRMVWTPKVKAVVKTTDKKSGDLKLTVEERRRLCAEPSPDAFSQIAASFGLDLSANVAGKGGGSLSTQSALTELAKRLGTRTVAIQLLRDGLYRLCEADINGRVGDFNYHIIQANMDQVMLRLVAIENISRSALIPADDGASNAIKSFEQAKLERDQKQSALIKATNILTDLDKRLRDAKQRNTNASASKAAGEAQLAQIDKDLNAKKSELEKLDRTKPENKPKIDKLEAQIANLESLNIRVKGHIAAEQQLIDALVAEIDSIIGTRTTAESTAVSAAQTLQEADRNLAPLQAAASQADRKLVPAAVTAIQDILYPDPRKTGLRTLIAACLTWLAKQEEEGSLLPRNSVMLGHCGNIINKSLEAATAKPS